MLKTRTTEFSLTVEYDGSFPCRVFYFYLEIMLPSSSSGCLSILFLVDVGIRLQRLDGPYQLYHFGSNKYANIFSFFSRVQELVHDWFPREHPPDDRCENWKDHSDHYSVRLPLQVFRSIANTTIDLTRPVPTIYYHHRNEFHPDSTYLWSVGRFPIATDRNRVTNVGVPGCSAGRRCSLAADGTVPVCWVRANAPSWE